MKNNNDLTGLPQRNMSLVPGLETMHVIKVTQFLPQRERDALYDALCENQHAFQPPGIPELSDTGGSLYLSFESDQANQQQINSVSKARNCLSKHILELLPALFKALSIESFSVPEITLTFINGLDGHCGGPHADDSGGRFQISLLYYFHKEPKAFRGGDLEFYSTDQASPTGHSSKPLSRINLEDNLLIAFPSQAFHGITDVQCDSDKFKHGRFVAVGFLGQK